VSGASAHDHGSVTEEAAKLWEALQEWAGRTATGSAVPSPECSVCPLCRLLGTVRETRPEVFAHLSTAASALSAALAELVVAHEREWSSPRPADIERIDIG
jgi:hypothetical protein